MQWIIIISFVIAYCQINLCRQSCDTWWNTCKYHQWLIMTTEMCFLHIKYLPLKVADVIMASILLFYKFPRIYPYTRHSIFHNMCILFFLFFFWFVFCFRFILHVTSVKSWKMLYWLRNLCIRGKQMLYPNGNMLICMMWLIYIRLYWSHLWLVSGTVYVQHG